MKSLWPGLSSIVYSLTWDENEHLPTLIVTPLFFSSSEQSVTKAWWKLFLPISSASHLFLCASYLEIFPLRSIKWPVKVDFPESTWPIIQRFIAVECYLCSVIGYTSFSTSYGISLSNSHLDFFSSEPLLFTDSFLLIYWTFGFFYSFYFWLFF